MNADKKREREKKTVSLMIRLYCRKRHHTSGGLCAECQALSDYAVQRSDRCPFMETKTFCSNCRVHCYKPEMRQQMRAVMRYAGPRMLLTHPILVLRHMEETMRRKRRNTHAG